MHAVVQEKVGYGKKEVKPSPFTDDLILYIERFQKKAIRANKTQPICRVQYQHTVSVVFLYTSSEQIRM